MNKLLKAIVYVCACVAVWAMPIPPARAQYLNKLYDYDSTSDFGYDIFVQPDSNYLIIGGGLDLHTFKGGMEWMTIQQDGSQILDKHGLKSATANIYEGSSGRIKRTPGGGYVVPITIQKPHPGLVRSLAGFTRLNAQLDTMFVRTYEDTDRYFEGLDDIALLQDGSVLLGGEHTDTFINSTAFAMLIKADSNGHLLWRKTYSKSSSLSSHTSSLQLLPDGRLLVGMDAAHLTSYTLNNNTLDYFQSRPWFALMDTAGNILRDTLWGTKYIGGGNIFRDVNGGYFHWGVLDSFFTDNPLNVQNQPYYVAHLDTNFKVEWRKTFVSNYSKRNIWKVIQLRDSSYLVVGDLVSYQGWAAKLDKWGTLVWENTYYRDTNAFTAYLVDAIEQPGGGYMMVGETRDGSQPNWHQQDMWLVGIDTNGCVVANCTPYVPNGVKEITVESAEIKVYPNPTHTTSFTVRSSAAGEMTIYTMLGQQVGNYSIVAGVQTIELPKWLSNGIYTVKFVSSDQHQQVIRLVYEP